MTGHQYNSDSTPLAQSEQKSTAPKKLLVVDDDIDLCDLYCIYFEKKGYHCKTAYNGLEAVTLLQEMDYDIVVSDVHMPGMDGMQLLDWIKENKPKAKVVMITGDKDESLVEKALRKHVDAYLCKPFEVLRLHIEVEVCLGFPDPTKHLGIHTAE